jgi:large conductance mechanosensitive channel
MWNEFKNFAFKGNAFDLAVGVIMGGAFGKIVDSIVQDLIMPIIGAITGGVSFSNYFLPLSANVKAGVYADAVKEGATLGYGNFITILINFLILAFILFQMVKISNRMKKAEPPPPPPGPTKDQELLQGILNQLSRR